MIDVTDLVEDRPCKPIPGKVLNPEIWYEGTRIGFRQPGGIVLDHRQFFLKVIRRQDNKLVTRIMKYHDDEFHAMKTERVAPSKGFA